jgi:pyruvate kinase
MVARGDLGVEMPPQEVPPLQKRIVEAARRLGRPVVVATQMLESMIQSPSPTRAEVSTWRPQCMTGPTRSCCRPRVLPGAWPVEAVAMMDKIAIAVEGDAGYNARVHFTDTPADPTTADALAEAADRIVRTVGASAIICFTISGSTARRVARERPSVPLLVLTPSAQTARRMGLLWGAHAVHTRDVGSFEEMIAKAKRCRCATAWQRLATASSWSQACRSDARVDQRPARRAGDRQRAEGLCAQAGAARR